MGCRSRRRTRRRRIGRRTARRRRSSATRARGRTRTGWSWSVDAHVVGAGVVAGAQLLPLQEQVVEEAGRAEAEPVGGQPVGAGGLVDHDEVLDRVLRGPDAAGGLDAYLPAGGGAEVA